jgi:preprotein translocase subunit SecG
MLTKTTGILAALFMATAIGLSVVNDIERGTSSILDNATQGEEGAGNVLDALNSLQPETSPLAVPQNDETPPANTEAPNLSLPVPAPDNGTPSAPSSN